MNQTIRVFIKYSWHLHGVTSREMTNRAPYNLGKKMFLGGLIVVSASLKLSMIVPPRSSYVGFLWSTTVMHVIMRNIFKENHNYFLFSRCN